jgi:putative oxygen-independent coproporphyrinogen III oxidase
LRNQGGKGNEVFLLPKAAYIHIPFCEHICHYCDFNKIFIQNQPVDQYLQMLKKEIELTLRHAPATCIDSIFVGGGTPTALDPLQLKALLQMVEELLLPLTNERLEYTFEANPGELSTEKLQLLFDYGVNRLSFGVQSFENHLLERIGRTHRAADVYDTVNKANQIGFTNYSIDLMYGLPKQTMEDAKLSLDQAFTLGAKHFSAYSLQVEPKTVFYNLFKKGRLPLPSQDEEADMYKLVINEMEAHGFQRYEVSNFAKTGFESRHNLTYWNNEEYYGFGAGAHSYVNGFRNANAGPLNKYIKLVRDDQLPSVESHKVSKQEAMEEELFLGLRKAEGVLKSAFLSKYNLSIDDTFRKEIRYHVQNGLLEEDESSVRLTDKGFFLGNEVFQTFIGVL